MAINYREGKASDVPFVISSWSQSYRRSYSSGIIQMADWSEIMQDQIRKLLLRRGVDLVVAENPGAEEGLADVHGWLAYERGFTVQSREREPDGWRYQFVESESPVVHYVFVKEPYRRFGIAKGLFRAAGIDRIDHFYFTCKTAVVSRIGGKFPGGEWNPLIARNHKSQMAEAA